MSQAIIREVKARSWFLSAGLGVSLLVHGLFFQSFLHLNQLPFKREYGVSILVPVVTPPAPPPVSPPKPPETKPLVPKKEPETRPILKIDDAKKINRVPLSHHRKEKAPSELSKPVKPVFGVTDQTLAPNGATGIGVRSGNTLFKEQEKEVTPKEAVKPYVTIPVFDLTTLPVFKKQEQPRYPAQLEQAEIQGEVLLSVTIDEKGRVTDVAVKKSDHALFSEAAVEAMFKSLFSPGLVNGTPVVTRIDIPITFLLED